MGNSSSVTNTSSNADPKPDHTFNHYPSRKAAETAAKNAGNGNQPVFHNTKRIGETKHFHPVDVHGKKVKDAAHYTFGKPNLVSGPSNNGRNNSNQLNGNKGNPNNQNKGNNSGKTNTPYKKTTTNGGTASKNINANGKASNANYNENKPVNSFKQKRNN